jgi:hypothetical protein
MGFPYSSGDVLTAADMNDLAGGELISWSTTSDFTISTTPSSYGSASFTLNSTRQILATLWIGELDSFSTNPINVYGFVIEPSTNDQIVSVIRGYTGVGGVMSISGSRHLVLGAGTYTWEFQALTNTGTCRADNASSVNRTTGYAVFDMGEG